MLGEDAPSERLDFAERDGSHSGPFKAETETANPTEKIEDIHKIPRFWAKIVVDLPGPLALW
jgi:hypothetical protein